MPTEGAGWSKRLFICSRQLLVGIKRHPSQCYALEARNYKFEARNKLQIINSKPMLALWVHTKFGCVGKQKVLNFKFGICFEFRVSYFEFPVRSTGGTALHSGKDFAVSFLIFLREPTKRMSFGAQLLSRLGVSVRTSWIAPDGCYPLPCCQFSNFKNWRVFGLSSLYLLRRYRAITQYITPIIITERLLSVN